MLGEIWPAGPAMVGYHRWHLPSVGARLRRLHAEPESASQFCAPYSGVSVRRRCDARDVAAAREWSAYHIRSPHGPPLATASRCIAPACLLSAFVGVCWAARWCCATASEQPPEPRDVLGYHIEACRVAGAACGSSSGRCCAAASRCAYASPATAGGAARGALGGHDDDLRRLPPAACLQWASRPGG